VNSPDVQTVNMSLCVANGANVAPEIAAKLVGEGQSGMGIDNPTKL
jgi:hypothetical protein